MIAVSCVLAPKSSITSGLGVGVNVIPAIIGSVGRTIVGYTVSAVWSCLA